MVKRQGWARLFISCNYSCTFLVKILELSHLSMLEAKLLLNKQKPKMYRLQRWWNLSKLVTNTLVIFGNFFNSIIPPLSAQERISIFKISMYTMGKLPPLSPHFIHGTIIRTGIQLVLYSHVFNTTVFALFKFKTLILF